MNTVRELRRLVEDLSDDIQVQHGRRTPPCEVLHYELGLPHETPRDDAEKVAAKAREQGEELEEDSIKLTVEHEDLHEALRRFVVNDMSQGMDVAQMAAHMLTVGRRMGLREAAQLFGED
jgi:hypothetical protein